jgi:hypothetical protein
VRAVGAETLLIKHQLLILNRTRRRAPNHTTLDRVVMGLCTLFVSPNRVRKVAAALKPATLLSFHQALKALKYCRLFSSQRPCKLDASLDVEDLGGRIAVIHDGQILANGDHGVRVCLFIRTPAAKLATCAFGE